MDPSRLLQGLPFVDSLFPSGGFAYSYGLESAVQDGALRVENFPAYTEQLLRWGTFRQDALAAAIAHRAVRGNRMEMLRAADQNLEAMKVIQELREGSRQMGRQVLRIAAERMDHTLLSQMDQQVQTGHLPGHHAVAMGAVLAACKWSEADTVQAFFYQTLAGWVSAALKLLPMGQSEGQKLIHSLGPCGVELSREIESLGLDDMAGWTPLHDIRSMRHHALQVRLFRS